jgi:OOP family OmpA-OmpF porin
VVLVALAIPGAARAEGASADIELIHPTWSEGSMPGIDSARFAEPGTIRGGLFFQFTKDPLILYERGTEYGSVVANRTTLVGGASWDIVERFGLRASMPLGLQWGSETPEFTRDGPVLGDLFVGGRLGLVTRDTVAVALRADVGIPSGTRAAWMGEARFRGIVGPTTMVSIKDIDLLADLSFTARPPVVTDKNFTLGSEFVASLGARYNIAPNQASVGIGYLQRNGLDYFFQRGAENPSELISTITYRPEPALQLEGGVGKGLAEGYGTSAFRTFVSLTWIRPPKANDPPPSLDLVRIPPPPEQVEVEPIIPEEPVWEERELARIDGERIVIRDPIEFEFATPNILPASLPTLQYVADLLNENWQIAHLVIEGHASEEGSFVYNYDLSIRRSRAIWEALIRAGVHPDRMSYRGMGEVVPRSEGGDEASLASNRRVEFEIVRQYRPDETPEQLRENVRLPWTGEPANVGTPPKPEAPPPPPKAPENLDMDDFFEDDEDDASMEPSGESQPSPAEASSPAPAPTEADSEPPMESESSETETETGTEAPSPPSTTEPAGEEAQ